MAIKSTGALPRHTGFFVNMRKQIIKKSKCKKCLNYFEHIYHYKARKYCSFDCEMKDGFGYKKTKKCSFCKSVFKIASNLQANQKTCSAECRYKYEKDRGMKRNARLRNILKMYTCKNCNKLFKADVSFQHVFCSYDCRNKNYSEKRIKKGNPNYKGGIYSKIDGSHKKGSKLQGKHLRACAKYKKEFVKKHGYQFCEVCKVNNNGTQKFEVHHIYYASRYPKHDQLHNFKNLIHICHECHKKFHSGEYKEKFIVLEKERGLKKLFI